MSILKLKDSQGNWIGVPTIKGDNGNGIQSAVLNNDYTLTLTFTDGTTYTTPSIRGEKGEQGEPATDMDIHICSSNEYDSETRIPTIANPDDKTFYLVPTEDGTSPDLFTEWVYVDGAWEMFGSMKIDLSGYLTDVTVGGTSITTDGVANIPIANTARLGVVKIKNDFGVMANGSGELAINGATTSEIKNRTANFKAITPIHQHESTFYGLAKAAGADEKDSTLAFGTYSDNAKSSIQNMLGITDKYTPKDWMAESETELVTNAHSVGDLFYIGETLYKVIADLNAGDAVNVGVNVEEVNVNNILTDYATKEDVENNVSIVEKSASGAIASFDDGMDNMPLKSLTININPVQDLHGYDSPWVAGGGKNLFDQENVTVTGSGVIVLAKAIPAGTYTISALITSTDTDVTYNRINLWDENNAQLAAVSLTRDTRASASFTIASACAKVVFYAASTAANSSGDTATFTKVQIELGNTATDWSPYENICPISGWTGMEIQRDGTNLFDGEMENGDINQYTGENNGTSSSRYRSKNYIPIRSGSYYFKSPNRTGTVRVFFYDKDKTFLWFTAWNVNAVNTFNSERTRYARFRFSTAKVDGDEQISINSPSSVTDYVPYVGRTIPISWQTEAGTVYGGKLDVLTGKLTVYPYYASYNGETLTGRWISDRDVYAVGTTPTIGAQVVNIGAEGTEIQLEPHEVASLLGQNNIFADTGDIEIEYFSQVDEDLIDYIETSLKPYAKEERLNDYVSDVQVNGTSIVTNNVANVPIATQNVIGALYTASEADGKVGTHTYRAIVPKVQHSSVFYGLAKAAGDVTQSSSTNSIGTYTDEAKTAIKQMLDIHDTIDSFVEEVTGTDVTITGQPSYRYNCGELYSLTVTPPSSGTIDFRFTSGSTPTVLTLPSTVKMPEWWVEVEANTIYEMCITDGIYCGVMSWAM